MRLNLGCGEYRAEGWVNVDLHDDLPGGPRPDVVVGRSEELLGAPGDPFALPFADGSADRIYCGHVLEHIPPESLGPYLREIHRVLSPDGLVLVVGPDCDHPDAPHPTAEDGGRRWPGDEHQWRSTAAATRAALPLVGFAFVPVNLELNTVDWPVVDRGPRWQFALLAGRPAAVVAALAASASAEAK